MLQKKFFSYLSKKFVLGKIFLGYSSERINPGQKYKTNYKYYLHNTTKVISGLEQNSLKKIYNLYKICFKSLHKTSSIEVAEMLKLLENSYRAVNIGLVNELKILCHKLRIDIHQVLSAAKTKPFGFNSFRQGLALEDIVFLLTLFLLIGLPKKFFKNNIYKFSKGHESQSNEMGN